jgi:hypothetical protein
MDAALGAGTGTKAECAPQILKKRKSFPGRAKPTRIVPTLVRVTKGLGMACRLLPRS